ncbi:hypothetical protein HD598_002745 [Neomicrococcus aestuarii]|uniref:DUF8175 domain-containing protein n=1 Tax=Neomicrococcus aestuarii TaxID=556325 RepID=A0A7W8TWB7_9MICC|nr:hypothetical protein [Neomicrococcus aestuarii]MBB5513998.1 hypothetical protein [Neomicrococcus aestuarii]
MAEEKDPLGSSWKLAGGVLALIVVAVVAVLFLTSPSQEKSDGASSLSPAPQAGQTSPPDVLAGGCPSLSMDKAFPVKAPATKWLRHPGGMILPTSEEFGPAIHDGNFWHCYSQTPSGALMAGIGLAFSFSAGHVKESAADSPARESYFAEQANTTAPSEYATIEGYRIIMATDAAAVVEYYGTQRGIEGTIRVNLLWDTSVGDWRLDLEAGIPSTTKTLDPTVFTRWR